MEPIGLTPSDIPTGQLKPPVTPETARVSGNLSSQRQCVGTRTDGQRCERAPIRGGTTCPLHGGKSPLARRAAQKLLLALVEPAVETLFAALQACDGQGDPLWSARVSAAKTLLSRAGLGEQAKLILQSDEDDVSNLDRDQLADEFETISQELRARANRKRMNVVINDLPNAETADPMTTSSPVE